MQKRAILFILLLLVIHISIGVPTTSSQPEVKEDLKIYTLSENTFLNLTINNYQTLRENLLTVLDVSEESSIDLNYVFVRNWKSSYLYLLYGTFLEDVKLNEYPNAKLEFQFNSPFPLDEENAVNTIEEILFTKLIKYKDAYIGYAEFDTFGRFFSTILPSGNYTPLLRWVDPLAIRTLGDVLIVDISSSKDNTVMKVYVIKSLSLRENKWRLSSVLATTNPLQNKTGVTSSLELIFKDVFIYSKPPVNMSGGYDSSIKSYVYKIENPYELASPREVEFEMYSFSPVVIINRYFNDTSFSVGDVVEVTLNVTVFNLGGPVFNVTINESDWWKTEGITLLEGDTNKFFAFIDSGTYRTVKYKIKIENNVPNEILIKPAKISIEFVDGLSLTYNSSSNVIHIANNSPFLNLIITPISNDPPSVSKGFSYRVTLVNEGDGDAKTVVFSDFLIGDLSSGRSIAINRSINFLSLEDLRMNSFVDARYIFNNRSYEIRSSSFILVPKLDAFVSFNGRALVTSSKVNDTVASYKVRVSNDSDEHSLKMDVYIRIFGGNLINSSYNFTREGEFYVAKNVVVKSSDSFSLDFNVSYQENTIQLTPFVIIKSNGITVFKSNVDYFFNTIDIEVSGLSEFLMSGEEFSFVVKVINKFDEPMFNATFSWAGSDDIEMFPNEVSRSIIEGRTTEELKYNFTAPDPGNYTLPDFRASYWYLGKFRVDTVKLGDVTVLSGLTLDVLDRVISVSVDENITLKVVIYSDYPEKYDNVMLVIGTPEQLEVVNNTLNGGIPVSLGSTEEVFIIVLKPSEPGEYTLNNFVVKYTFEGRDFESMMGGSVSISVREVVTQSYLLWFVPAALLSLAIAVILRRKVMSG